MIVCVSISSAHSAKRIAFIVGIDSYDHLPEYRQLKRAVNDAHAISGQFEQLGYQVKQYENLSRSVFYTKWQDFLDMVKPGDTVALFLSGHGIEIAGRNFLLPRDIPTIKWGRQDQLERESISISDLLSDLRERKRRPGITLLILDACRENPLIPAEYRKGGKSFGGLAEMKPPQGTFIMYSAAANETALEMISPNDLDKHSVFVRALLPLMRQSDLDISVLAKMVRQKVVELTLESPHKQTPAYYDGLVGFFCLSGKCSGLNFQPGQNATVFKLPTLYKPFVELGQPDKPQKKLVQPDKPQMATGYQPPLRKPLPAIKRFNISDSRDLIGDDLARLRGVEDVSACAEQCAQREGCIAFAYDKWNRWCFPKSSVSLMRIEPKSVSGVSKSENPPRLSSIKLDLQIYQNKTFFRQEGYRTLTGTTFNACFLQCVKEDQCIAFSFDKSTKRCALFNSTEEYFSDETVDSGIKRQIIN